MFSSNWVFYSECFNWFDFNRRIRAEPRRRQVSTLTEDTIVFYFRLPSFAVGRKRTFLITVYRLLPGFYWTLARLSSRSVTIKKTFTRKKSKKKKKQKKNRQNLSQTTVSTVDFCGFLLTGFSSFTEFFFLFFLFFFFWNCPFFLLCSCSSQSELTGFLFLFFCVFFGCFFSFSKFSLRVHAVTTVSKWILP